MAEGVHLALAGGPLAGVVGGDDRVVLDTDDSHAIGRRPEVAVAGLIELQGQDVTWLPPYQRNVNTVFQSYALFPHLTIFENVAFGLRRKKVKDKEVKARVSEMLQETLRS